MKTKLITLLITFIFSWNAYSQEETCQEIILPTGWSLVSTYIEIPLIETEAHIFFSPIINSLIISKSDYGSAYVPEWGFTHGVYNSDGYLIKLSEQDTLNYCGIQIIPEEYPIVIEEGWNMISYLRDTPQNATVALSDIADEIILVKDYLGNVYLPSMDYNGIGDLQPGQGYQIKMSSEQTLIYDANEN